MEQFSDAEIKKYFNMAKIYFDKAFPSGTDIVSIKKAEEKALKKYLNFYTKNLDKGKDTYNSSLKKARYEWFILETIEKIMEMNDLQILDSIDLNSLYNQIDKFKEFIDENKYESYLEEQDFGRE